jgi:Zn-dependent protease
MMRPSIRFGRVAGIEVGAHWSLLVIGALFTYTLATGILPDIQPDAGGSYWAAALLGIVLFFGSVLAHELAHSLVAIRRGQRVEGITLWLLGGVARLRDEARDAKSELLVAIAGPLTSLALGAAFIGAAIGLDVTLDDGSLLPTVAAWLAVVNIVLAVFNMLPGAPLDGGRVLSAVIWMVRKDRRGAQIAAARVGRILGLGLIGLGLWATATDSQYGSLWTALVGWFVFEASRSEEEQARMARNLDGRTVGDVMSTALPHIHEWATISQLYAQHDNTLPPHVILDDWGGSPTALVERALLTGAAPDAELRSRGIPLGRLPAVTPAASLRDALSRGLPLLAVDGGQIVGVVGFDELQRQDSQGSVRSR